MNTFMRVVKPVVHRRLRIFHPTLRPRIYRLCLVSLGKTERKHYDKSENAGRWNRTIFLYEYIVKNSHWVMENNLLGYEVDRNRKQVITKQIGPKLDNDRWWKCVSGILSANSLNSMKVYSVLPNEKPL